MLKQMSVLLARFTYVYRKYPSPTFSEALKERILNTSVKLAAVMWQESDLKSLRLTLGTQDTIAQDSRGSFDKRVAPKFSLLFPSSSFSPRFPFPRSSSFSFISFSIPWRLSIFLSRLFYCTLQPLFFFLLLLLSSSVFS